MNVQIDSPEGDSKKFKLDKLVTTIGFGEACDIELGYSERPVRIGMFIRQNEKFNFKSLLEPGEILVNGMSFEQMIECSDQMVLSCGDYAIQLNEESASPQNLPRKTHLNHQQQLSQPPQGLSTPPLNVVGARQAYGGDIPDSRFKSREASLEQIIPPSKTKLQAIEPPPLEKKWNENRILQQVHASMKPSWLDIKSDREKYNQFSKWIYEIIQSQPELSYPGEEELKLLFEKFSRSPSLLNLLQTEELVELRLFTTSDILICTPHGKFLQNSPFQNTTHLLWELRQFFKSSGKDMPSKMGEALVFENENWKLEIQSAGEKEKAIVAKFTSMRFPSLENHRHLNRITEAQHQVLNNLIQEKKRILLAIDASLPESAYFESFIQTLNERGYSIFTAPDSDTEKAPRVISSSIDKVSEKMHLYEAPYLITDSVHTLFDNRLTEKIISSSYGVLCPIKIRSNEDVAAKLLLLSKMNNSWPAATHAEIIAELFQVVVRIEKHRGAVKFLIHRLEIAGEGNLFMSHSNLDISNEKESIHKSTSPSVKRNPPRQTPQPGPAPQSTLGIREA